MIADLKPYPRMKDSGVPSLGQVPAHWEVLPLGRLGHLFKGNGGSKDDEVASGIPCIRYGDLYTRHEFFITRSKACIAPERSASYTAIEKGDLLFAASGETHEDIGRSAVNLLDGNALCGGDVIVFRPYRAFDSRFLGFAADSPPARVQKATMGRGFTVVHVYSTQLKQLVLSVPPISEQAAIARFLDHADRRIRHYIRAKQKLVKLLEEQKRAIIQHAVTRGLNADVRLKPSGVEWLGEVPEHWKIVPLKFLSRRIQNGSTPPTSEPMFFENGTVPWYGPSSCGVADQVGAPVRHLAEVAFSLGRARLIHAPALLVVVIGATVGRMALLMEDGATNQQITAYEIRSVRTNPRFALSQLRIAEHWLRATASTATIPILDTSEVSRLPVAVPTIEEQNYIVRHMEETTARPRLAIDRAEREIALLREYRIRLMADVITGKLDVRAAAAQLPDEAHEPQLIDEGKGIDASDDPMVDAAELEEVEA